MVDVRQSVGSRIRDLRIASGLTLSDLARASEVAKATLSNIESGEANPTLDTLCNLSIALKVPLSSFFGEQEADVKVIRAADMEPISGGTIRGRLVSTFDVESAHFEIFVGALVTGGGHRSPGHLRGVIEHVFLHRGRIKVGPEGREVVLEEGDYLRMHADGAHTYEALTDDTLITAIMQYPQDR